MVVCSTSSHQSSSAYYFKQCINGDCWYWLSFVIDHLTKAGDHHGEFNDFADFGFWMVKFEISNKNLKTKSVVYYPPWETPSFLLLRTL
jgi:hypothetical protein